jgi:hypothetical protein
LSLYGFNWPVSGLKEMLGTYETRYETSGTTVKMVLSQFNNYRSLKSNPQHEASFSEIYRTTIVSIQPYV